MSLIDALTARVEAMAMRRARVWASALAADPANPARGKADGRLALSTPSKLDAILSRPWLTWPTPEALRRRA